jgi:hypothetical protein
MNRLTRDTVNGCAGERVSGLANGHMNQPLEAVLRN